MQASAEFLEVLQNEAEHFLATHPADGTHNVSAQAVDEPFPNFVGTAVLSLASFRPSFAGYLMPTSVWATVARQYENMLLETNPQTDVMYPLKPSPVLDESSRIPTAFFQIEAVKAFITVHKKFTALLYQSTNIPNVDSIHELPNVVGKMTHSNNEWYGFSIASSPITKASMIMVYPAQPWQLTKYTDSRTTLVTETAQLYNSVHAAHATASSGPAKLQWLYDVLDGKKEQETIVINNGDFVVAKDTKWPAGDFNKAYEWSQSIQNQAGASLPLGLAKSVWFLVMPFDRSILSIRDLNDNHVPLLKLMQSETLDYLKKTFGFKPEDVVMYFHYAPTFYHLHLHVNHVSVLTETTYCGKVEELETVINNIEMNRDYYQQCTRRICLKVNEPLAQKFAQAQQQ